MLLSIRILIGFIAVGLASESVAATNSQTELETYLSKLTLQAAPLATHKKWRQLLHYEPNAFGDQQSVIVSPDFFLAEKGVSDAEAELAATLRAFYAPVSGEDNSEHALCRFPARVHWLRTKLLFAEIPLPQVRCEKFRQWSRFWYFRSISVISVSGYFGNPASAFGHLLIKLNNSPPGESDDLLATGVNFGAAIPNDESLPVYIAKGLLGGYRATFSNRKFYAQYNVYADSEARDMWEYELNLSHYQERLLIYHLWEIIDKEFVYYFLRENCGLRMAEVLEMVLETDLDSNESGWYLPISVFHGLREANKTSGGTLIKDIRYIPSKEKRFVSRYNLLNVRQQKYFDEFVARAPDMSDEIEGSLDETHMAEVVDTLIAFYDYQIAGDRFDKTKGDEQHKRAQILTVLENHRAQLNVSDSLNERTVVPPPSSGSRPSRISLGAYSVEDGDEGALLEFSPAYFDLLGHNHFNHSELLVGDFSFRKTDKDSLELNRFDFISVQELSNDTTGYLDGRSVSWRAYAGINEKFVGCDDCLQLELRAGIGKSFQATQGVFVYGLIDAGIESENEDVVLTPSLGTVIGRSAKFKLNLEAGRKFYSETEDDVDTFSLQARLEVTLNHEIRLELREAIGREASLSYQYFW
ncbi:MAG: DUF4105 domain-containing protein [Pseudomonadota bacterium]